VNRNKPNQKALRRAETKGKGDETMKLLTVEMDITGVAPLQFGRPIQSLKKSGEGADAFEDRTWRERMHIDPQGRLFIPGIAFKKSVAQAAAYLSESIPGKGAQKYTKHVNGGILCFDPLILHDGEGRAITTDSVEIETKPGPSELHGLRLFVPADGKVGGTKRVWRTFPVLTDPWRCRASVIITSPILVDRPEKIEQYAKHAGMVIGLGSYRPASASGGHFGRFVVSNFKVGEADGEHASAA
jgi:hypothetical protein